MVNSLETLRNEDNLFWENLEKDRHNFEVALTVLLMRQAHYPPFWRPKSYRKEWRKDLLAFITASGYLNDLRALLTSEDI